MEDKKIVLFWHLVPLLLLLLFILILRIWFLGREGAVVVVNNNRLPPHWNFTICLCPLPLPPPPLQMPITSNFIYLLITTPSSRYLVVLVLGAQPNVPKTSKIGQIIWRVMKLFRHHHHILPPYKIIYFLQTCGPSRPILMPIKPAVFSYYYKSNPSPSEDLLHHQYLTRFVTRI